MVTEGQLLWTPSPEFIRDSNLTRYLGWLRENRSIDFADYEALPRWSVQDIDGFWDSIWDYFSVQSDAPYIRAHNSDEMPGTRWFEGSRVNYAEHLLRHEAKAGEGQAALQACSETSSAGGDELARARTSGAHSGDAIARFGRRAGRPRRGLYA